MILYCDQAAAARPDEEALECFVGACRTLYANQESSHYGASEIRRALDDAGNEMVRLLTGSDAFTVCWCGSGTGAFRLLESSGFLKGRRVVTSRLEHPALTAMLKRSAGEVTELGNTGEGRIVPAPGVWDFAAFHAVQSELGTVQDLPALTAALPERCIRFTDAVQMAGKMDLAPAAAVSDLIALSGVKFGAPGGGALLVRKNRSWSTAFLEAVSAARHPGYTVPRVHAPEALSMFRALENRCAHLAETLEKMRELNTFLRRELAGTDLRFTVPEESSSPFILHMFLPGKQGAVVVRMLSERGIWAGSGSACASESPTGSSALRAIGYTGKKSFSGLRFSFGPDFCREQAEFLVKNLLEVLKNY